ncbi:unnamed protein product [Arabis nemorensis]|uniref:MATH domain-containing protein n=1 Tax=Arabis nemorensis TaxID=586526 RepID=A0A565BXL6_9BRAS|nr:unnamed protein product [Arabis nemorensis]
MGNAADNKFTWVIKDFSPLKSMQIHSEKFVVGGCKWRLLAYTSHVLNSRTTYLSLYLDVPDSETLPFGWRRHTKYRLTVVNQLSENLSQVKESQQWFDQSISGHPEIIPLIKLYDKDSGFLVNGDLKIVVEIDVLELIGNLDVSVKSPEVTQPLKRITREDAVVSKYLVKETSSVKEIIDVQVLPSQVEFVSRVFKKYPDIASQLGAKNESLRTAGMYVFLSLIKTLCKSLQELTDDDLIEADNALTYLKCSGIKLDWLEQKLEEVKETKKQEQIGECRMQELDEDLNGVKQNCSDIEALLEKKKEELKSFKQKWSDIEALLEKEKAKVVAARAPTLTLDEVV